jgi:hypothetical protein
MSNPKKCFGCGEPKKAGMILCAGCWRTVPQHLRRQFHGAMGIRAKRVAARRIYDWLRDQAEKVAPGIYHDRRTNSLHFDAPELLAHFGLPDTPANRDLVTEQAMRVAAEEFPNASRSVLTAHDNDPT